MDIKVSGITSEVMAKALDQAKAGRLHILNEMAKTISATRTQMSNFAPRIITIKIPVDKIRDVIGPGGKMIRRVIERTGVKIDVEDNGTVNVASADEASAAKAIGIIQELTATPELNKTYMGRCSGLPTSAPLSRSCRAPTASCTSPRSRITASRTSGMSSRKANKSW